MSQLQNDFTTGATGGLGWAGLLGQMAGSLIPGIGGVAGNLLQFGLSKAFSSGEQSAEQARDQVNEDFDNNLKKTIFSGTTTGPMAEIHARQKNLAQNDAVQQRIRQQGYDTAEKLATGAVQSGNLAMQNAGRQTGALKETALGAAYKMGSSPAALAAVGGSVAGKAGDAFAQLYARAGQQAQSGMAAAGRVAQGAESTASQMGMERYKRNVQPWELKGMDPGAAARVADAGSQASSQAKTQDTVMPGNIAEYMASNLGGLSGQQGGYMQFKNNMTPDPNQHNVIKDAYDKNEPYNNWGWG